MGRSVGGGGAEEEREVGNVVGEKAEREEREEDEKDREMKSLGRRQLETSMGFLLGFTTRERPQVLYRWPEFHDLPRTMVLSAPYCDGSLWPTAMLLILEPIRMKPLYRRAVALVGPMRGVVSRLKWGRGTHAASGTRLVGW